VAGYAEGRARRAIPVGFDPPYALPRPPLGTDRAGKKTDWA